MNKRHYLLNLLILITGLLLATPQTMGDTPLSMKQIADSLQSYTRFPSNVPRVRVRNIRVRNKSVEIQTNMTLSYLSLSPSELRALERKISMWTLGCPDGKVRILSDNYELSELITARYRERSGQQRYQLPHYKPLVESSDRSWEARKGLDGRHLAIAPSHGAYYKAQNNAWIWQRATVWTIVEDLYTHEMTNQWLVPMLENAGAYIFQPRERDIQTNEQTVSIPSAATRNDSHIAIGVPEEGQYGIYYKTARNTNGQTVDIQVVHKGIPTRYKVRTDIGKGVWQWIGQHEFGTSVDSNYLVIEGQGISEMRFGGGMGSIVREGEQSGHPRWEEGARYWLEYAGWPGSVWDINESANDYKDDLQCRGYWINHLTGGSACNPDQEGLSVPVELFVAVHTDGERDSKDQGLSGTLAIYTDKDKNGSKQLGNGVSRIICRDLSDYVQSQITQDMDATMDRKWMRRELKNEAYCESRYPVIPALLLEVLSHYNINDMHYGLDPKYQFIINRAIYKGIVRYIHAQDKSSYTIQPLPVKDMQMSVKGDKTVLSWTPVQDELEPSATPTYYVVYTRTDNGDWDNGQVCRSTTYTFTPERGKRYDLRVAAGNDGGISFVSETLSTYRAPKDKEKGWVMIVNGFNLVGGPEWFRDSTMMGIVPETYQVPYMYSRSYIGNQFEYDRRLQWKSDDNCGLGMCNRDYQDEIMAGNTFDYPVWHGKELAKAGYSYISRNITTLTEIDTAFMMADIILGQEKMPFADNLKNALTTYVAQGGRVLLSGANISQLSKDEKKFADKTLHYQPRSLRASHSGKIRYANQTFRLYTEPNAQAIHTAQPDGIEPTFVSYNVARYDDTRIGAGVGWKDGKARTLVFSFPLESVSDFAGIYRAAVKWMSE